MVGLYIAALAVVHILFTLFVRPYFMPSPDVWSGVWTVTLLGGLCANQLDLNLRRKRLDQWLDQRSLR